MQTEEEQISDEKRMIKTAFISVFNKHGLEPILRWLVRNSVTIYSTGGTQAFIEGFGIEVKSVEDLTGYPSILGGRVKTLHPKVFGGILGRRENESDQKEMAQYQIPEIDLVIVDLYPFEETVKAGGSEEDIIEKIDIGGVSLIRAAAKNFNDVLVISSRDQYRDLVKLLEATQGFTSLIHRKIAAGDAFRLTSYYDDAIFNYFQGNEPECLAVEFEFVRYLKYGENPHQEFAALYSSDNSDPLAVSNFSITYGGLDSYVTVTDVDRSIETIVRMCAGAQFNGLNPHKAMVAVKHGNACGASFGSVSEQDLIQNTMSGDCEAVLGAVVACNFTITAELLQLIFRSNDPQGKKWGMLAALVCKEIEPGAVAILKERKSDCIVYTNKNFDWKRMGLNSLQTETLFRKVRGGILYQDASMFVPLISSDTKESSHIVHSGDISELQKTDIILAWAINATSNSNTITIVRDRKLLGNAVGQQKRVASSKLAVEKAQFALEFGNQQTLVENNQNAIAWGDSFFPYPDGVEVLWKAGVKAVFATHGSKRDQDVIDFCKEKGITFVTWDNSVARGFYGH